MALNSSEELINDIRLGKMVILMDDEDRENEGDLVIASECVSPVEINFMATHARGLICMPMTRERCELLKLPLMVDNNASGFGTKFTLSIEAAEGVTTGISAADRALTVKSAIARNATADDIVQPGHIFPLMADVGGVLTRAGHTEAACDLARLAGYQPSGVICEIMNDDGSMARRPELEAFAKKHNIKIGTIADLIHYRVLNEKTIELESEGVIDTNYGEFTLRCYRDTLEDSIHFVLIRGDVSVGEPALVRVQVANTVRDILCAHTPSSTGWNMNRAMAHIAKEDRGVIVLLSSAETRDSLLYSTELVLGRAPMLASALNGNMRVGLGSQILRDVGITEMRLMGAPVKYNAISGFDLEVVEFVAFEE